MSSYFRDPRYVERFEQVVDGVVTVGIWLEPEASKAAAQEILFR